MSEIDISGGDVYGGMRDTLDSLVGDLAGNHDGTAGEAGSTPGEMNDEVDENHGPVDERTESVADKVENNPGMNPEHRNSHLRDIHNDIVDAQNSSDPEERAAAERAKQDLKDRGLWDQDYADARQEELDEEDEEEEEDNPGEESETGDDGTEEENNGGPGDDLPDDSDYSNPPAIDPLVIDLDGDGVELTALSQSEAHFDLNVDGFAERTGWVSPDDGLLAIDVNGNGQIDDTTELFGDQTGFDNGFAQLAALDSNSDGKIDASDDGFNDLLVWRDLDQDGVSNDGELQSLSEIGIVSINVSADEVSETNAGNTITHRGSFTFDDGSIGLIEDVLFESDLVDTVALLPGDFQYHSDALLIPTLWGYGDIPSTQVALSLDEDLRTQANALLDYLSAGDIEAFVESFEDYVLSWAGVEGVDEGSRGEFVNAKYLAFFEKAYGVDFVQRIGSTRQQSDPNHIAGPRINAQFNELIRAC
ncbi:hypothetical protein [Aliiroseovarius sp. 2305UL8-7]|uniref:hypothetical protein n=1 Tax=Aliiroseovarius conchicola TaxID=3121637 RepID=UPI00352732E9